MPFSTRYFKTETKNYILQNYSKDIKILDIGAGCGTYSDMLSPEGYTNIDCVEAFESYVETYSLKNKYKNVFVGDVTKLDIDFSQYDLVIMGDVLEHIELKAAQTLLNKLENKDIIVCVPFESPQEEQFGNTYEIHLQADLSFTNFFSRYPGFYPLCLRFDYGIFVKKYNDIINIEIDENPLPEKYIGFIDGRFPDAVLKNINDIVSPVVEEPIITPGNSQVTIVTGIWDLGRGEISDSFKRSYDNYLDKMSLLLQADVFMYIFADKSDEDFIWKYRKKENTVVNTMSLEELKEWFPFTDKTNEIRQKEEWLSQASWLRESPQATLSGYNPVVMSKMFMLNNVTIWNPFNSDYFFWLDAGITNTVHYGYFTHNKVIDNLPYFYDIEDKFLFLSYPYDGGNEIHGFPRIEMHKWSNTHHVKYVCRGGFFGGKKEHVNQMNAYYYGYLNDTLAAGLMGTEESIFTIIAHNSKDKVNRYEIGGDGLVWPFFENLKDIKNKPRLTSDNKKVWSDVKTNLYVLTFNYPQQFENLCKSFEEADSSFLNKPRKILVNNSTDRSTDQAYSDLCSKYGFEEIKKDNIGICGGRQFCAEHFDQSDADYYIFFEDDMFLFPTGTQTSCKNEFKNYTSNLYEKSLKIIYNDKLDYLKLSFSELYGDCSEQWAWYNVPNDVRLKYFPEKPDKPVIGLDPDMPRTKFSYMGKYKDLRYLIGEVHYCNWPLWFSREGNKQVFLETTWARPYEQTWMSYVFQQQKLGKIKAAVLLLSPINHNREHYYEAEERREN